MAELSSMFARRMIDQAAQGSDADRLLRIVGLDPEAGPDLQRFVDEDDYFTLLETIAEEAAGPLDFHIRMGAAMRHDDLGVMGMAWRAAPTVADALTRFVRYSRVLVRGPTYGLVSEEGRAAFTMERDDRRRGAWLSSETAFVTVLSLIREAAGGDVSPTEVRYRHAPLRSAPALEAHFGCPVRFEQPEGALVLDGSVMARSQRVGDESLHRFFEGLLDKEISSVPTELTLDEQVRRQIAERLTDGVPRLGAVARGLAMSQRTLQRRLNALGASYPALVESTQREMAERLLRTTEHGLAEVAFLTGFSEHSAFTRAFKRWTGQAPSVFRREARS